MCKISVIVPIYNMEQYLKECLNSIEKQTIFDDIEVILVNDGSTDKSLEIIENFSNKHKNTLVINQENQGVSAARNNGINKSSAEFVCFIDPDDFYPKNNILSKLYDAAVNNNVLIAGGSFSKLKDGKFLTEFSGMYKMYTFKKDGVMQYSDYQWDYGYHRFIYSRKMLLDNNIYFPLYVRFQDPPFFVKAMIAAKKFYALKAVTYCYRVGHQDFEWNKKRTSHLLQGLTDNLRMSREKALADLHWLTIRRLFSEYKDRIKNNFNDEEIIALLQAFQKEIDLPLLLSTKDNVWTELDKNIYIQSLPIIKQLFLRIRQ